MQQLNCTVSFLLVLGVLLAALTPLAATARRELPVVTDGERGSGAGQGMAAVRADQGGVVSAGIGSKPEKATKDAGELNRRREDEMVVSRHLRTRKLPLDDKIHFDASMPFTADYHPVQRHPPKHN